MINMTRFFKTIFRISLIEIVFILAIILIKYLLKMNNWSENVERLLGWLVLGMGALFLITVGIYGIIENKQDITEPESTRQRFQAIERKYAWFLQAGISLPSLTLIVLFLYWVMPTTIGMSIPFAAGILIRNSISYFWNRNKQPDSETL